MMDGHDVGVVSPRGSVSVAATSKFLVFDDKHHESLCPAQHVVHLPFLSPGSHFPIWCTMAVSGSSVATVPSWLIVIFTSSQTP